MSITFILVSLIIIATAIASIRGFKNREFKAAYDFEVEKLAVYKDYKRLFTAGFLHANWLHLIFNMLALFYFGAMLGSTIGPFGFLIVYLTGIVGGHFYAFRIQKSNSGYSTVGSSGGVIAIMMACIALIPGMVIHLFFIPFPGWLLGVAYFIFAIYGIRSRKEGISHEAHLAGGIAGILLAIIFQPIALQQNLWVILLLLVPSLAFVFFLFKYSHYLIIGTRKPRDNYTLEDRANIQRKITEAQVDEILEKINKKGISSLSKKEKEILNKYSNP